MRFVPISKELPHIHGRDNGMITFITSPNGLIFMSSQSDYLFRTIENVAENQASETTASRQFGDQQTTMSGFTRKGGRLMVDASHNNYILSEKPLPSLPGWRIMHLLRVETILNNIYLPLAGNMGKIILSFCIFIGLSVAVLYKMSRSNIVRRKKAETALAESEERFRNMSSSMRDALLAPAKYLDDYKTGFDKFLSTGRGSAIGKTIELSALRKNGAEFPIELSLSSYHVDGSLHAVGTVRDISERKAAETEREKLISDLESALKNIKVLKGLVPICQHCKKIRDDRGFWNRVESYIALSEDSDLSHSICPECAEKYYPDMGLYDD